MKRKKFLRYMSVLPLGGLVMKANALNSWLQMPENGTKMPVLFLGHGSPMNAIEENEFVVGFRKIAQYIPTPKAILCVSAHWETKGTFVTSMTHPKTIHDFGGFPQALFDVQYPAPGSPELATTTQKVVSTTQVQLDDKWGLDHGAWSVIKHLYPKANIPVVQLSLDYSQPAEYHYQLAKDLAELRKRGILIIGSGNMVHNLRMVAFDKLNEDSYGFDWALEANAKMNAYIRSGNHTALVNYRSQGTPFQLAIPTPEHYLPLLYTLALQDKNEEVKLFNDKAIGGSLSMTSVQIGG